MIRYIYTFFVALFIAVFVGTGIALFYESPKYPDQPVGYEFPRTTEPTEKDRQAQIEFQEKEKAYSESRREYNRNVSIIVLVAAVALLIIALAFEQKIGIIADGILLGGIFTLLYGIMRGMDSDSPKYRFIVTAVGLAIALALGYLKFARNIESKQSVSKSSKK